MSNSKYTLPVFDSLELNVELEHSHFRYDYLQPVKAGYQLVELLNHPLTQGSYLNSDSNQYLEATVPYLKKILVIYFYSKNWGDASLSHLKQLHAIRNEIKYNDGQLLIIDGSGEDSNLQQTLWDNNLLLSVYADPENNIAKLFKVYADESPAWSRYSGIDTNVALPATFVLDQFLRVMFDFSNEDILSDLPGYDITHAVNKANGYHTVKRSA